MGLKVSKPKTIEEKLIKMENGQRDRYSCLNESCKCFKELEDPSEYFCQWEHHKCIDIMAIRQGKNNNICKCGSCEHKCSCVSLFIEGFYDTFRCQSGNYHICVCPILRKRRIPIDECRARHHIQKDLNS